MRFMDEKELDPLRNVHFAKGRMDSRSGKLSVRKPGQRVDNTCSKFRNLLSYLFDPHRFPRWPLLILLCTIARQARTVFIQDPPQTIEEDLMITGKMRQVFASRPFP